MHSKSRQKAKQWSNEEATGKQNQIYTGSVSVRNVQVSSVL